MPEEQPTIPEEVQHEEREATFPQTFEQALVERFILADERLGELFDRAASEGKNPVQYFIQESNIPKLERIYPSREIQKVLESIQELSPDVERSVFIQHVRKSVEPFIRAELSDPEVRRRIEALEEEEKIKFTDPETGKALLCTLKENEHELLFSDKQKISPREKVLEVMWSEDLMGPTGGRALRRIFHEIARHLKEQPDIQAVTGVSWMMSHPVIKRFGFEVFPKVEFPKTQKIGSAKMGNTARQGKPYGDPITTEQVLFGAIARDMFIARYG
jgi:hypothetical protein